MARPPFDWAGWWQWTSTVPERQDDLLAVLNGAVGDRLIAADSAQAIPMDLRHNGVPLDLPAVADARPHIIVWVHGLMATDRFWGQVAPVGFDARLAGDLDATSVCVRYNTGRHVSTSGEGLSALLSDMVARWPVEVRDITLVGHSMGGLVARSAVHYGQHSNWVARCRRMVMLGVPQRGAPLEQITHIAAFTLRAIPNPWTWGISWLLRQRSDGIRDLRHGYLVHEEWQERAVDALTIGRRYPLEPLTHIAHYVAAGTLGSAERHMLGRLFGDAMVRPFSAKDEGVMGRPTSRAATESVVFPGVSHVGIAGDDAVYDQLVRWCATPE